MRKLFSLLILTLAAAPAMADFAPPGQVPEPEMLSLMGLGFAALFVSRKIKK